MVKRLHSDLDSDVDLEDNTQKDQGWDEGPAFFFPVGFSGSCLFSSIPLCIGFSIF